MTDLRFLLDEHVATAAANELRRRGIECVTLAEAGRLGLPDESHLEWALTNRYVVVTFDRDFLVLNAHGIQHAGIVYFASGQAGASVVVPALLQLTTESSLEELRSQVRFA